MYPNSIKECLASKFHNLHSRLACVDTVSMFQSLIVRTDTLTNTPLSFPCLLKVVMLGDISTGKTSLVYRFTQGYYRDDGHPPTTGATFSVKKIQTMGGVCNIQIWDTAGVPERTKFAHLYYKTADAAIVCYDVANPRRSYEVLCIWLEELKRHMTGTWHVILVCLTRICCTHTPINTFLSILCFFEWERPIDVERNLVVAIAVTKTDLIIGDESSMNVRLINDVKELAGKYSCIFILTSAKANKSIHELFQLVADSIILFKDQPKNKQQNHTNNNNISPTSTTKITQAFNNNNYNGNHNGKTFYSSQTIVNTGGDDESKAHESMMEYILPVSLSKGSCCVIS